METTTKIIEGLGYLILIVVILGGAIYQTINYDRDFHD